MTPYEYRKEMIDTSAAPVDAAMAINFPALWMSGFCAPLGRVGATIPYRDGIRAVVVTPRARGRAVEACSDETPASGRSLELRPIPPAERRRDLIGALEEVEQCATRVTRRAHELVRK